MTCELGAIVGDQPLGYSEAADNVLPSTLSVFSGTRSLAATAGRAMRSANPTMKLYLGGALFSLARPLLWSLPGA